MVRSPRPPPGMLVIKRILSVVLAVFASFMLIAPIRSLLEALGHFVAGRTDEGLKSSVTTTILFLICLVIFQVARSIWKDRRPAALVAAAPVTPLANPFGEVLPPPVPPSQAPAFGSSAFAPGDR